MGGEAGRRCGTNELWIENYHDDDAVDGDDDNHGDDDDINAADDGDGGSYDYAFSVNLANFQTLLKFKTHFAEHTKTPNSKLSQKLIKTPNMSHELFNSVVGCILQGPQCNDFMLHFVGDSIL